MQFDPSLLRLNDIAPVKVTFVGASGTGRHMVGFYTVDGKDIRDVRMLFDDVGAPALIPYVSSVFLGNRLSGKVPVFFLIENGRDLNASEPWFADAASAHNGKWRFLTAGDSDAAYPALEKGQIVWKNERGDTLSAASEASLDNKEIVLVWQANDGGIHPVRGCIYHSVGYGLYPDFNPDGERHALLIPDPSERATLRLLMTGRDAQIMTGTPTAEFQLHLGERNYSALVRNRTGILSELSAETEMTGMTVEIPPDFDDTPDIDGYENVSVVTVGGQSVSIERDGSVLRFSGRAKSSLYDALLARVKVKSDAASVAETAVRVTFETAEGPFVKSAKIEIVAETEPAFPNGAATPHETKKIFQSFFTKPEKTPEDLPSFLTEALPVKTLGKTALIIEAFGSVGKQAAEALASKGWHLLLHSSRPGNDLARFAAELQQRFGIKVSYASADLSFEGKAATFISELAQTHGSFNAVVNTLSDEGGRSVENWHFDPRAAMLLAESFVGQVSAGAGGVFIQQIPCGGKNCLDSMTAAALTAFVEHADLSPVRVVGFCGAQRIASTLFYLTDEDCLSGQIIRIASR